MPLSCVPVSVYVRPPVKAMDETVGRQVSLSPPVGVYSHSVRLAVLISTSPFGSTSIRSRNAPLLLRTVLRPDGIVVLDVVCCVIVLATGSYSNSDIGGVPIDGDDES